MNSFRQKITEIPITVSRPEFVKDATGKRVRRQINVTSFRRVDTISSGRRFLHYLVDSFIIWLINFGIQMMLTSVSEAAFLPGEVRFVIFSLQPSYFLVFIGYYMIFEFFFQKTPGKFLSRSRVINEYCEKPDGGTLFLRTIIRFIPFDGITCISDRGWHDKWSNTWVVSDKDYHAWKALLAKNENTIIPERNFE
jgi:uncharacterized RDD family membrane protein YckC